MPARLLVRPLSLLLILLAIFTASRGLVRALPGDPIETMVAESGTAIPAAALRAELRLDRPFWRSTLEDLSDAVLHGDLGSSILSRKPVAPVLKVRLRRTVALGLLAVALALLVSVPLGTWAAAYPGRRADRLCSAYGAIVAALPTPWVGPILLILLSLWLPVFPVGGGVALPALTLALGFSALWARLIRERVRESILHGSAAGARARGISEWKVLLKYGLLPVSGALAAYLGTQLGAVLAGSAVVEVIFDWKGIGSLLVESVLRRDYPLVEATTFVMAGAALTGNLLGDWAQSFLDPRRTREVP